MEICKRNTGLEKEQFICLFNSLPGVYAVIKHIETASAALLIYLMKMRTGMPSQDLGYLFKISETTVQRLIAKIRTVLKSEFVPHNINYVRSREELMEHNTEMSNLLYDPNNQQLVMLVADGTYIYIDKSQNYTHQKKTFSGKKKRNFIRMMNVTACDGTIIYCVGPFAATTNDATILENLFDTTVMFDNLLPGDIMLLDRGFRDVVRKLESKNLVVKMPSLIQNSERKKQLSTKDANRSRLVTALRFVVETRNGHIKQIWKQFNNIQSAYAQVYLSDDIEICCGLINKYYPVFGSNNGRAAEVVNRMMAKLDEVNIVGNVVTKQDFQKNIKKFTQFYAFNQLSEIQKDRLFWISLGNYQIQQAVSYAQMHIKQNENHFIAYKCPDEICKQYFPLLCVNDVEPALFMMKLNSRFRSNITHRTFVLINQSNISENTCDERVVLGYFCECYIGWRTVGCCSHIMTMIMFMLVTKGCNLKDPSGFLNNLFD